MKIALGTVQFGMRYGVANPGGQVNASEVQRIIATARSMGIDTLDTAAAYGRSEEVLGQIGIDGFKVVSKLPPRESLNCIVEDWVTACVENSLANLNQKILYGFLLHRPQELLNEDGSKIYDTLKILKKQGVIEKLGVSVYEAEELDSLLPYYDFDLVQAPMNLLDRRILESGLLRRLKEAGTEVHIRSAFLQGLLLMPAHERPAYFERWKDLFESFHNWINKERITPLEACLGFLNQQSDVDRIVVGVDSRDQLLDIFDAVNVNISSIPAALQTSDISLINPAKWTL